jgi:hypothetical protein
MLDAVERRGVRRDGVCEEEGRREEGEKRGLKNR